MTSETVVLLMGPTAAGKTDLAVRLSERHPFEIISVDSAMIYRGMDIGTNKPSPEVLARAPHRLIDIREPEERYSAGAFRSDAEREIRRILEAGRIPLLVGGTGLYFRALRRGLSDLPAADRRIRARISQQAQRDGWAAMHARLEEVDAVSADRIHPNDPQRIQRALEVFEITGRPISELQGARRGLPYRALSHVRAPADRSALRARIAERFQRMLDSGFEDEVRRLRSRGMLDPGMPSMRAVGYRQMWQYLDGQVGYEEMTRRAVAATHRLAKRQMTWLRSEPDAARLPDGDAEAASKILNSL